AWYGGGGLGASEWGRIDDAITGACTASYVIGRFTAGAGSTCARKPSPMKSEDVIAAKGRPFTGAEYLASLRDGRDVYIYGERVDDVTTHPAFRNAARSIARLYDALHDGKTKE